MIVIYRYGSRGWYVRAFAAQEYRIYFGPHGPTDNRPSECQWMVPQLGFDCDC